MTGLLAIVFAAAACVSGGATAEPSPTVPTPPVSGTVPAPTPTAEPSASPAAQPLTKMAVERVFANVDLPGMVYLTHAGDGTGRLFLVLKSGSIMVLDGQGAAPASVFLDIVDQVSDVSEEGLLGLAFDPQYRSNGYFYVHYSALESRQSVISRFSVSGADPDRADAASERILLEIPQPYANHNGGQVAFGPDGYLYIGLGDGGGAGDPEGNGQLTSTLLGSILRIDVSAVDSSGSYSVPPDNPFSGLGEDRREEIWAYGLRNPWRFTFDRDTGDLWAADVGQNRFEEIDIIRPGRNYGWNVMEGFACFRPMSECRREGLEPPLAVYDHSDGCSITGGYVYRGSRLPALYGAYVYGDFCSGRIWALRQVDGEVTERVELADSNLPISSFGEGPSGELFILSLNGGIYRLSERR